MCLETVGDEALDGIKEAARPERQYGIQIQARKVTTVKPKVSREYSVPDPGSSFYNRIIAVRCRTLSECHSIGTRRLRGRRLHVLLFVLVLLFGAAHFAFFSTSLILIALIAALARWGPSVALKTDPKIGSSPSSTTNHGLQRPLKKLKSSMVVTK